MERYIVNQIILAVINTMFTTCMFDNFIIFGVGFSLINQHFPSIRPFKTNL